ncbi:MAG: tetratricopeptide repeat protein [Victivallaceae bacterium]|nr:tetratricopeptide repeat protein [Victivallaceae bacterium]
MKARTRTKLLIYALPALLALAVRLLLLADWWSSPVRWYYRIGGLDMQTVLQTGVWLYHGQGTFTLYKGLLAAVLLFNAGTASPETVVIVQLLGGVIIAPLTAWCALRIWGRIYWAAVSGVLAALYAPLLMYQVLVLKESFMLFFALLSLSAVLLVHKKHFTAPLLWWGGIGLALPAICRISGLAFSGLASLWIVAALAKKFRYDRKQVWLRTGFLLLGLLTVFLPVSIINAWLTEGDYFLPVHSPVKYIVRLGGVVNPSTLNVPVAGTPEAKQKSTDTVGFIVNMARKAPLVFSASEIPNNVNYYFLKYKLFPLEYLAGPLLLLPLAVAALVLLSLNGGMVRKESILFVFVLSYVLPLCFFYPLARYRLVLIPVFCMVAPYPVFAIWKAWRARKRFLLLLPPVIWALVLYVNLPPDGFLRATDFFTYGKGMQFTAGSPATALPYFYQAYQMTPDKPVYCYYLGIAALTAGKAGQAEQLFHRIDPAAMGKETVRYYYYYYGEALRLQHKFKAAAELYRQALATQPPKPLRQLLEKSLESCHGK